jgi:hypothetical protein
MQEALTAIQRLTDAVNQLNTQLNERAAEPNELYSSYTSAWSAAKKVLNRVVDLGVAVVDYTPNQEA